MRHHFDSSSENASALPVEFQIFNFLRGGQMSVTEQLKLIHRLFDKVHSSPTQPPPPQADDEWQNLF